MRHVEALCKPRACVEAVTALNNRAAEEGSGGNLLSLGSWALAGDLAPALGSPEVWDLTGENSLKPGAAHFFIKGQKVFSAS